MTGSMRGGAAVALALILCGACAVEDPEPQATATASFEAASSQVLARTRDLVARAGSFDADAALASLPASRWNGVTIRLDDLHGEAEVEAFATTSAPRESARQEIALAPESGAFRYRAGEVFSAEVDLAAEPIAAIEIPIRSRRIHAMELGWSAEPAASMPRRMNAKVGIARIDVVPDGELRTYRLGVARILRKRLPPGARLRRLFLRPSVSEDDELEIGSVRIVDKRERYAREPVGQGYASAGGELRRVMHVVSPRTLRYRLALPEGPLRLRAGFSVLEAGDPISLRIGIDGESVATVEAGEPDVWHPVDVDVSAFAGRTVDLRISLRSGAGNVGFLSSPRVSQPPRGKRNLIFVLQDTLRADRLSAYGHDRRTSPWLESLSGNASLFVHAYSQASKTRPSVPSIMTGLYPTATGVWHFSDSLDERYLTLAEILRSQGFETVAFVPNGNAGPFAGLHQGYDRVIEHYEGSDVSPRADVMLDRVRRTWDAEFGDRNLFAYIHLVDPHGPYDPPAPHDRWYRERSGDGAPVPEADPAFDPPGETAPSVWGRRLRYDGEVRFNDGELARFFARLDEADRLDDSLVVLTADHGEHLGEHGLWGHHPPGYTQTLRVPLVLAVPGQHAPARIEGPVGLIDVLPTVLDLLEIERAPLLLQGESLLQQDAPRVVVSDEVIGRDRGDERPWGSIFFGNRHVVTSRAFFRRGELANPELQPRERVRVYDPVTDPGEHAPLSAATDSRLAEDAVGLLGDLQRENRALWRAFTGGATQTVELDPETQERLRALGYLR